MHIAWRDETLRTGACMITNPQESSSTNDARDNTSNHSIAQRALLSNSSGLFTSLIRHHQTPFRLDSSLYSDNQRETRTNSLDAQQPQAHELRESFACILLRRTL
eukprot:GHVN01079674.1.p1 GENE.GHVN01079674.1~~GHVN01079674.1.p1  ORF type:complete len:105 (+),score=6.34 GHVN01079674.1:59-373(+)